MTDRIAFKDLEMLCRKYNCTQAVLLVHDSDGRDHVVTWGKGIEESGQAADFGNELKDLLGWPKSLHAQPSRVKKLQARIKELETAINRVLDDEEANTGWGPDVTTVQYLHKVVKRGVQS